jgi:septal ring factor EnvC (AmiA/AmiB activator)
MNRLFSFCIMAALLTAFAGSVSVSVQAAPPPPSKRDALAGHEARLAQEREKERGLKEKLRAAEKNMEETRKALVSLAAEIKNNEGRLQTLYRRIENMEDEQAGLTEKMEKDVANFGHMIMALQRVRRVPPEALLVRPGEPVDTARSAMLLQNTLPVLYQRAETLRADIARIESLQADLETDRREVEQKSAALKKRRSNMAAMLEKRESLYENTRSDHKEQQQTVKAIASQAKSLKELVQKLDANKKRMQAARIAGQAVRSSPPPRPAPSIGKGSGAQLPVAGFVRVAYGQEDDFGAASKGITIDSRPGGIIVAPMSGTVRFAGYFKRFGELVIIEHPGGYHSLVAGLAKIDTVVGRNVVAGEPVGTLPEAGNEGTSSVYYELRHNGEPVNPSVKIRLPS